MARQSWEAANDPALARKRPPLREQIKSPYFWVAILAATCVLAILEVSNAGWAYGLAAALYLVGLIASGMSRRAGSRR
jgi:C4-dicarboxylate transporter